MMHEEIKETQKVLPQGPIKRFAKVSSNWRWALA